MPSIYDIIWSKQFWLTSNLSWDDVKVNGKSIMPSCWDLWMSVYVAFSILIIRYIWEAIIARYVNESKTIREKKFETLCSNDNSLKNGDICNSEEVLKEYLKDSSYSRRQVERSIRRYKLTITSSKKKKIAECFWFLVFHFGIFSYGLWCMKDKKWLLDIKECWIGWPVGHIMPSEIYWYYMIQFGFYLSLLFSLYFDVRRKDFSQMLIHHLATLILLLLSYCDNFYRIGSLVLLLHDCCDVFLQMTKMAKYLKYQRLCNALFVIFSMMWLITRLIIFPIKIVKSCLFDAPILLSCSNCQLPYIYYAISSMLCVLQILHVMWFFFIIKAIKKALVGGNIKGDARSETESSESN